MSEIGKNCLVAHGSNPCNCWDRQPFMGHGYYAGMEETYSKRIDELMKQNSLLLAALKKIEKAGTIPWKDSDAVHVEYWAQIAKQAIAEVEGK